MGRGGRLGGADFAVACSIGGVFDGRGGSCGAAAARGWGSKGFASVGFAATGGASRPLASGSFVSDCLGSGNLGVTGRALVGVVSMRSERSSAAGNGARGGRGLAAEGSGGGGGCALIGVAGALAAADASAGDCLEPNPPPVPALASPGSSAITCRICARILSIPGPAPFDASGITQKSQI
jgi:hypothetical protein